jgi:acetate kinase
MKILVINAGSSSLKYQFFDMDTERVLAKGQCDRIGLDGSTISHTRAGGRPTETRKPFSGHKEAFMAVVSALTEGEERVIDSVSGIDAVGHRVVHAGETYKDSVFITDEVLDTIARLSELAPLHNPPQVNAIRACREVFGDGLPMAAVFDTAFHQTMPRRAFMFPIPYEYYEKYSIRRYGFHGTSHKYVSRRYFEITGRNPAGSKIIVCHLGNGSSITAVKDGVCLDTSMGLTPLDGFIMGTRCGGIDPSVVTYIAAKENLGPDGMNDLLNKKSGFLGISGISSDCRDLRRAASSGDDRAALALELLVYQIKKFIGGYAAAMNGTDALLFTGGIGENDMAVRAGVCSNMEYLGLEIDPALNDDASQGENVFSRPGSRVTAMVIPTNEEIMIARDTLEVVSAR